MNEKEYFTKSQFTELLNKLYDILSEAEAEGIITNLDDLMDRIGELETEIKRLTKSEIIKEIRKILELWSPNLISWMRKRGYKLGKLVEELAPPTLGEMYAMLEEENRRLREEIERLKKMKITQEQAKILKELENKLKELSEQLKKSEIEKVSKEIERLKEIIKDIEEYVQIPKPELVFIQHAEPIDKEDLEAIEEILGMPYFEAIEKYYDAISKGDTTTIEDFRKKIEEVLNILRRRYALRGKRWMYEF